MNINFTIGQIVSVTKAFSQPEVDYYCQTISGDRNPIHSDSAYAATTPFGACIVPGIMVTSLFGGLLGSKLPGTGTIHLGQTARFQKPVLIGEEITATLEITSIREDKPVMTLRTIVRKQDGSIAVDGEAVVKFNAGIGAL